MAVFSWFFGKRKRTSTSSAGKAYEYVTGNVELTIRSNRGEPLQAVHNEILRKWTPGKEYLWDEYDPTSLIDSDDKRHVLANQLLYARVTIFRALRNRKRDIRGLDPLRYAMEVPEVAQELAAQFPEAFRGGELFRSLDVHPKQPSRTGPEAARDPAVLEKVVCEAIADHFQLAPATININVPLSASVEQADGIDVMEIGMDIMERLELPIPEDRWDKFLDDEVAARPQITPARFVRLFQEVGIAPTQTE